MNQTVQSQSFKETWSLRMINSFNLGFPSYKHWSTHIEHIKHSKHKLKCLGLLRPMRFFSCASSKYGCAAPNHIGYALCKCANQCLDNLFEESVLSVEGQIPLRFHKTYLD